MTKYDINKFGGDGAGNPDHGGRFVRIVKEQYISGQIPWIVISAAAVGNTRVTEELHEIYDSARASGNVEKLVDSMVKLHEDLIDGLIVSDVYRNLARGNTHKYRQHMLEVLKRDDVSLPNFLPHGEFFSSAIYTAFLFEAGFPVQHISHHSTPIITTGDPSDAEVDLGESRERMMLYNYPNPKIEGGYFGMDRNGNITTLGHGGSDYKAIATQVLLKILGEEAETILWKTTPGGVMTADPKHVKTARTVPYLSYDEAEAAGRVIQSKAARLAREQDAQFRVRTILDSDNGVTLVSSDSHEAGVKIVAHRGVDKDYSAVYLVGNLIEEEKRRLGSLTNYAISVQPDQIIVENARLGDALRDIHRKLLE
jgi:aspartate kinase